jgi:hypothetical protein
MKAFVIARDRVSYAEQCVKALKRVGLDVVIIDRESTWSPMLDWLTDERRDTEIVRVTNGHPHNLWHPDGVLASMVTPNERFILTDCDVVPARNCPGDWPQVLSELLDAYPMHCKVGLSLRIDNLPDCFTYAERVRLWEAKYWSDGPYDSPVWEVDAGTGVDGPPVRVYRASVDTTLAMYRRFEPFRIDPALRTAPPYSALHLPWYEDSANESDELRYYREHVAPSVSHWLNPEAWSVT